MLDELIAHRRAEIAQIDAQLKVLKRKLLFAVISLHFSFLGGFVFLVWLCGSFWYGASLGLGIATTAIALAARKAGCSFLEVLKTCFIIDSGGEG